MKEENFPTDEEIIAYVDLCIGELRLKFKENPYYFSDCREHDVSAYLYHLIARNEIFLKEFPYKYDDGEGRTKMLHMEAVTPGKINTNTGSFDLGIINPRDRMDFEFFIAIEVKWLEKFDDTAEKAISRDVIKLCNLKNKVKSKRILIFNCTEPFPNGFKKNVDKLKQDKDDLLIHFIESDEFSG